MKGYIINADKNFKLEICFFSLFIIGLLVVLNVSVNFSAPAISDDNSDFALSQSSIAPDLSKRLNCANSWGQTFLDVPATKKNKIIPLLAFHISASGFTVYNSSTFHIRLRAPPLGVDSFG